MSYDGIDVFYVEIARLSHVKCIVKLYLRDEIKK